MKRILSSKWIWGTIIFLIALYLIPNLLVSFKGKTEKISFQSGDIIIKGLLVRPKTAGPHPAIVMLHGSGGSHQGHNKWYNKFHSNELVRRGFAVLHYTKRGSGDNNVDYDLTTFEDLINDAIAAVDFIKNQTGIDAAHIGLFGVSESGWFTPEIADRAGDIDFIINRVSSPLSFNETTLFEIRNDVLASGYTEKQIDDEILPFIQRIRDYYMRTARDRSYAMSAEREAINAIYQEWYENGKYQDIFSRQLSDYDPDIYSLRASKFVYDPKPFLAKIDIPMLYYYGEDDINVPTDECVSYLQELKKETGKDITVHVFPGTGHYMHRYKKMPIEGLYVKGYFDLIGSWAENQIK